MEEKKGEKRGGDDDDPEHEQMKKVRVLGLEVNQEDEDVEEDWSDERQYVDEKSGKHLDHGLVTTARKEEVTFMKGILLYDEVTKEECWKETGKAPVSTKFVDLNKGTDEVPDIRCRLVARDFKPKGEKDREDLFAAMPPLEAKKLLFRMAAAQRKTWQRGGLEKMKLMFIDVKKAHLNGIVPEEDRVYVELPAEANAPGKCGRLRRWLYGMRPAASAWEKDYSERLQAVGFARGKSAPTVFFNPTTLVRAVVHGDDFTFLGYEEDLRDLEEEMRTWYELKVRGILGGEAGDDIEIIILNRTVRWVGDVIEYEADMKHAKVICEEMGLDASSRGLTTATVKETREEVEEWMAEELLGKSEATRFRGLAARSNYLAQDRMDLQYAAKELCREMSGPKPSSWKKLKRLARYLLEYPRLVWIFGKGEDSEPNVIDVYSDSDWAGCLKTRKSTSGGVMSISGGGVKSWSSTQATIATSSGEAEYYALVKSAAEALGLKSLAKDLGWEFRIRIWVDSTAAKSIASRTGIGRVRHMEVKYLWIQEALKGKKFELRKIDGKQNPADILTKPKSAVEMESMLGAAGASLRMRTKKAKWADMEGEDVMWGQL
jgi:hypothetical protein